MKKLTVLIPVFNEEDNIKDCLEAVKWADEILVADSYSTDRTLDIAGAYPNVRIIQREYNYSTDQKNWAIPQASGSWVLIVDADERVPLELSDEIRAVTEDEGKPFEAYSIRRDNFFLGRRMRFSGWQNDFVTRLFVKGKARYEDKYVHGSLIVDGRTGRLKNRLIHYSIKDIGSYLEKIDRYSSWKAREKLEKGKKVNPVILGARPVLTFLRDYIMRLGILDGIYGLVLCGLSAFSEFLKYAKLWELKRAAVRKKES
ncbi:MAG: glycosyltransferase family 2 protein [Elusimicrobia bacterium]|nr:glycosyltransferase family 2 protein [Elusimicrobiota bacterium]